MKYLDSDSKYFVFKCWKYHECSLLDCEISAHFIIIFLLYHSECLKMLWQNSTIAVFACFRCYSLICFSLLLLLLCIFSSLHACFYFKFIVCLLFLAWAVCSNNFNKNTTNHDSFHETIHVYNFQLVNQESVCLIDLCELTTL